MAVLKVYDGANFVAVGGDSGGLAGTGGYFVVGSAQPLLPGSRILTAGSSVNVRSDGTAIYVDALTGAGAAAAGALDKDFYYYRQVGSTQGIHFDRYVVPGRIIGNANANQNIVVNSMNFVPLIVVRSVLVDSLDINCASTGAGSIFRVGIYTNSADTILYPFQAVATSTIRAGSTGAFSRFPITETLSANNLYWVCIFIGTATLTLKGMAASDCFPILGQNTSSSSLAVGWLAGQVFSNGLPAIVSTLSATPLTSSIPEFLIRTSI